MNGKALLCKCTLTHHMKTENFMQTCLHNKRHKEAEVLPGLTAVIISIPSVVWCEIHCVFPSRVSEHQITVWSWPQRYSWNTESAHYIKTNKQTRKSSASSSVHGLCISSVRAGGFTSACHFTEPFDLHVSAPPPERSEHDATTHHTWGLTTENALTSCLIFTQGSKIGKNHYIPLQKQPKSLCVVLTFRVGGLCLVDSHYHCHWNTNQIAMVLLFLTVIINFGSTLFMTPDLRKSSVKQVRY